MGQNTPSIVNLDSLDVCGVVVKGSVYLFLLVLQVLTEKLWKVLSQDVPGLNRDGHVKCCMYI